MGFDMDVASLEPGPAVAHSLRRPSLLVVDDDVDTRHLVREILGDHFDVIEAGDGLTALALALLHRPDVVLSDVRMPELDGFALAEALAGVINKVILMTADFVSRADVIASGAVGLLEKPFPLSALRAAVANV
ncbi:MAG: response regulator [Actinobacteria bacterium]|uniref:Unannotated protein n=1 Tax=freshwater metagenome TaxID=449393 RepID=A0A6J6PKA4_9ZZZZ|nr:response regulator [Actinomycetota bacterium]